MGSIIFVYACLLVRQMIVVIRQGKGFVILIKLCVWQKELKRPGLNFYLIFITVIYGPIRENNICLFRGVAFQ